MRSSISLYTRFVQSGMGAIFSSTGGVCVRAFDLSGGGSEDEGGDVQGQCGVRMGL